MKRVTLLALILCVSQNVIYLHASFTAEKKRVRNHKAYAKFLVGTAFTTAAIGSFFGGIGFLTRGTRVCYEQGNNLRLLGCFIIGPLLTALSIPTGEFGFKLLKDGAIGLMNPPKEEEEEENKDTGKATFKKN